MALPFGGKYVALEFVLRGYVVSGALQGDSVTSILSRGPDVRARCSKEIPRFESRIGMKADRKSVV